MSKMIDQLYSCVFLMIVIDFVLRLQYVPYLVVGLVVLVTTLAVFNDHKAGPAINKLYKENTIKILCTLMALSVYVGLFPAKDVGIDRPFDASLMAWAWLIISPKLHVYKFVGETK